MVSNYFFIFALIQTQIRDMNMFKTNALFAHV